MNKSLRLEKHIFDLAGWIQQTSSVDFVSHVVVDNSVDLSDGTEHVFLVGTDENYSVDRGVRPVLFYIRATNPVMYG